MKKVKGEEWSHVESKSLVAVAGWDYGFNFRDISLIMAG